MTEIGRTLEKAVDKTISIQVLLTYKLVLELSTAAHVPRQQIELTQLPWKCRRSNFPILLNLLIK